MSKLRNIVYLSEEQKEILFDAGTITVDGKTLDYSENDIYIVPQHWTADGSTVPEFKLKNAAGHEVVIVTNNGIIKAGAFSGNGELLTGLNANNIVLGTVDFNRLPKAERNTPGVVMGSDTIVVDSDGRLHVDAEVLNLTGKVFYTSSSTQPTNLTVDDLWIQIIE